MLNEKSEDILKGLYKSASFVIQAIVFQKTGKYLRLQKELLEQVSDDERRVVQTFLKLKNGESIDFGTMSDALFAWAKKQITE
jgi:hypothetical protein